MNTRIPLWMWMAPALLVALGGCGGGGGSTPDPVTIDLPSSATQQRSLGATTGLFDALLCGDRGTISPVGPFRAFLTFDLSLLPPGATVTDAQLILRQEGGVGNLFSTGSEIVVDHVDYGTGYPAPMHYVGGSLDDDIGTLSTSTANGTRALTVTNQVATDLATRTRSQFRIRFAPNEVFNNGTPDHTNFEGALNLQGTGQLPVLSVTYLP